MKTSVSQLIDELFGKGFTPHGIAYVLSMLADEVAPYAKEDTDAAFRHNDLMTARFELLSN